MSENGEIYTADKNFTLPPAVTNSTSAGALCKTSGICTICKLQVGKRVLNHLQQSSSWFAIVQNLKMRVLKNMIGPHERTFSPSPSYPCSRICTLVLLLLPGLQGGVPACLQPSTGPLSPFQVWRSTG